jgi:hypothetical protein
VGSGDELGVWAVLTALGVVSATLLLAPAHSRAEREPPLT